MATSNYTSIRPWVGGIQAISATSSTAVGITISSASAASATYMGPNLAIFVAETQNIRWRDDGTDPTATVGMPVSAGSYFSYDGDLRKIKFIGQAGQAIVNVALYTAG